MLLGHSCFGVFYMAQDWLSSVGHEKGKEKSTVIVSLLEFGLHSVFSISFAWVGSSLDVKPLQKRFRSFKRLEILAYRIRSLRLLWSVLS